MTQNPNNAPEKRTEAPRDLQFVIRALETQACADDPAPETLLKLIRLHQRNGAHDEAVPLLRRLLAKDPANVTSLVDLGLCLAHCRQFEEARFTLERALELDPRNEGVFVAFARLAFMEGNAEGQVLNLQRAVSIAPKRTDIRLALGEVLRRHGEFGAAQAQYESLLQIDPGHEAGRFALGTIIMRRGDLSGAAENFRRVVMINPSAFDAHLNLAQCYFHQKKYAMAIPPLVTTLKGMKNNPRALFLLAHCYANIGDWDRALVTIEKLSEIEPDNLKVTKTLADLYDKAGELDSAREVYRKLARRFPEIDSYTMAHADLLRRLRRHSDSLAVLEVLFKEHPGHIDGHRLYGEVLFEMGRPKAALEEFRKVLLVNDEFIPSFRGIARVMRTLGNKREEYDALARIVSLKKHTTEELFRLGLLERELNLPTSLERFRQVVEQEPDSSWGREASYFLRHSEPSPKPKAA